MKSLTGFLKTTIVGGALYLVPIVVILAVLGKVHAVTSKLITPMTEDLELHDIGGINAARLLAIVAVVLACFVAGLFARTRVAQRFVGWLERAILSNLPGYSLISALGADVAGTGHTETAMKVVLARIEDAWQLGLLVEWVDETHAAVFVPGAPDPKSGSVYLMADDRFKLVDMSIREAMKCIKGLGIGSKALLAERL
jgi:uncharacterized membrane protein